MIKNYQRITLNKIHILILNSNNLLHLENLDELISENYVINT